MSIDEILNRIAEHLRSDFGELIDSLNRRVEDLQDKVETLEIQNRDKDKQISKLDKFVKTLLDTPGRINPLDAVLIVQDPSICVVRLPSGCVSDEELEVLRLFGYASLDEFAVEALRLHLQRSHKP